MGRDILLARVSSPLGGTIATASETKSNSSGKRLETGLEQLETFIGQDVPDLGHQLGSLLDQEGPAPHPRSPFFPEDLIKF